MQKKSPFGAIFCSYLNLSMSWRCKDSIQCFTNGITDVIGLCRNGILCLRGELKSVFLLKYLRMCIFLLYLCGKINKFVKNNFVKLFNYEVLRKKSIDYQIVASR
jgi:hypothetical protein